MPKNNPPKQFCEWSFEQGDRKWQQNEQEHGFELRDDFFWRKTKWMGAGISGGDPHGTHKTGGRAQGVGRALHPCGKVVGPLVCSLFHKSSNILEQIIFKFQDIWRTFIFGAFLLHG